MQIDKQVLGFLADVLYMKGIICYDEYEAIQEVKRPIDLEHITERMLNGEYKSYRKGELYTSS